MVKLTKRFKTMVERLPANEATVPVEQAVPMLKQFNTTKFDQTVDIAIRLGIDPKQADQLVRGSIVLPHGIGKSKRVVVFAKGDQADGGQGGRRRRGREPTSWPRRSKMAGPISTPASPLPT